MGCGLWVGMHAPFSSSSSSGSRVPGVVRTNCGTGSGNDTTSPAPGRRWRAERPTAEGHHRRGTHSNDCNGELHGAQRRLQATATAHGEGDGQGDGYGDGQGDGLGHAHGRARTT